MTKSINNFFVFILILLGAQSHALEKTVRYNISEQPNAIQIETIGEGKPMVFLPGFTTPGSIWKETITHVALNRKSYRVSYAGFNGIPSIEMPWYTNIKNSIITYIQEQQLNDIIIMGHSMGGNLAVDIAATLPNKVSKIIIVDALPCMREVMMPNVPVENLVYDNPYNKQMLHMDDQQFKNMATMMASNMTNTAHKKETIANWILEADRKTWVYGYTDLLKLDLRDTLKKISCETLIIGASFPNLKIAKENFEKQYANLSNKTLKMAPKSKHFVMFDQPQWFYEVTKAFLANEKK
ncbi:alpha/beta fold hydrolase [Aquimarina hainanensis]|uniref:Alpha/beta fold hydrolase n=1 Tax=Aquimarina hainanensis TaxID=1578017 RepID=A0ABW5NCK9_9FLAO